MVDLTISHKEMLRTLVKLRREESIPEEFCVVSSLSKPSIRSADDSKWIEVDGLSPLALESLSHANFIFSIAHYESIDTGGGTTTQCEFTRDCYITPAGFRAVDNDYATVDDILMRRPPVEITHSLAEFRNDFPDPSRLAFVMMQFGTTKAHGQVFSAIRAALEPHQFHVLRADSKGYHDDLWWNVATYIYGCRFGIAVFERIEEDAFNPNVSLEVGYMAGIGKPVCYLKERTLRTLHTDLSGKLYQPFDLHDCEKSIPKVLWKWMNDKGLMVRQLERSDDEAGE